MDVAAREATVPAVASGVIVATEEIAAGYEGEPIDIGFNARYLLDIAGQLESQDARFELSDPGSPTLVRDGDDASALYVLMPMRV